MLLVRTIMLRDRLLDRRQSADADASMGKDVGRCVGRGFPEGEVKRGGLKGGIGESGWLRNVVSFCSRPGYGNGESWPCCLLLPSFILRSF